jgi:hypothetical protein
MQRFFGVGHVTLHGNAAMYQVVKLSDLAFIIEHFDNYPLKTKKNMEIFYYLSKLFTLAHPFFTFAFA